MASRFAFNYARQRKWLPSSRIASSETPAHIEQPWHLHIRQWSSAISGSHHSSHAATLTSPSMPLSQLGPPPPEAVVVVPPTAHPQRANRGSHTSTAVTRVGRPGTRALVLRISAICLSVSSSRRRECCSVQQPARSSSSRSTWARGGRGAAAVIALRTASRRRRRPRAVSRQHSAIAPNCAPAAATLPRPSSTRLPLAHRRCLGELGWQKAKTKAREKPPRLAPHYTGYRVGLTPAAHIIRYNNKKASATISRLRAGGVGLQPAR